MDEPSRLFRIGWSNATTLAVMVRVQVICAAASPDANIMPLAASISANTESLGRLKPACRRSRLSTRKSRCFMTKSPVHQKCPPQRWRSVAACVAGPFRNRHGKQPLFHLRSDPCVRGRGFQKRVLSPIPTPPIPLTGAMLRSVSRSKNVANGHMRQTAARQVVAPLQPACGRMSQGILGCGKRTEREAPATRAGTTTREPYKSVTCTRMEASLRCGGTRCAEHRRHRPVSGRMGSMRAQRQLAAVCRTQPRGPDSSKGVGATVGIWQH